MVLQLLDNLSNFGGIVRTSVFLMYFYLKSNYDDFKMF